MKSKAFSSVVILGTLAVVFIGCVVQNKPADSTPPAATAAPAATNTAAPTATATPTVAPTTTATPTTTGTVTPAPTGKVMNKPKALGVDAGAADGG